MQGSFWRQYLSVRTFKRFFLCFLHSFFGPSKAFFFFKYCFSALGGSFGEFICQQRKAIKAMLTMETSRDRFYCCFFVWFFCFSGHKLRPGSAEWDHPWRAFSFCDRLCMEQHLPSPAKEIQPIYGKPHKIHTHTHTLTPSSTTIKEPSSQENPWLTFTQI